MALIYGSSDPLKSGDTSRKVKAGKLRKLATKLYTDDLRTEPSEIIRRHRLEIAAHFYPDAVISHRSALEGTLSPAGKLHLTVPYTAAAIRKLPGLELRIWKGPLPQPEDTRTSVNDEAGLYTASAARAVLENFQLARARSDNESKALSTQELEHWFDRQLRLLGEQWLTDLLQQASELAERFEWQRELSRLQEFAKAIQGKPSTHQLSSDLAHARSQGTPFDPDRMRIFTELHAHLCTEQFVELSAAPVSEVENRAFWEAYFSNFIEGTRFSVEEAQEIVKETDTAKTLTRNRPKDAHDILETYRLIADPQISDRIATNPNKYIQLIKIRHARMMASRAEWGPGEFKLRNNEVGHRIFVRPELVTETIKRAWKASLDLKSATARAFYMLFVIAEVHPFQDGNGRISRLGMNAIFEHAGKMRLIIPTSLRNDYLSVLEALTTNGNTTPYIRFAHKLMDFNSRMPFGSFEQSYAHFKDTGALDEPTNSNFSLQHFV